MYCGPLPVLKDNTINASLQKGVRGAFATPVIEITFYNDYIHILYDISKRHMFRYSVSKIMVSKAATHGIM